MCAQLVPGTLQVSSDPSFTPRGGSLLSCCSCSSAPSHPLPPNPSQSAPPPSRWSSSSCTRRPPPPLKRRCEVRLYDGAAAEKDSLTAVKLKPSQNWKQRRCWRPNVREQVGGTRRVAAVPQEPAPAGPIRGLAFLPQKMHHVEHCWDFRCEVKQCSTLKVQQLAPSKLFLLLWTSSTILQIEKLS